MTGMEKPFALPGWETLRQIASGRYGAVYEISRPAADGGNEVSALKVISIPQNSSEIEDLFNSGYTKSAVISHFNAVLDEVKQEFACIAAVKDHPNIVRCSEIRYIQKDDGIGWDVFIRTECLDSLASSRKNLFQEESIVSCGIEICRALSFCRANNVIHRDIKPQNIFLTSDGTFKLGDFGIAKTVEYNSGGMRIGTYNYMAPEVFNNEPYDHRADVYSLGLVLYWLLNERRLPFQPMPPAVPISSELDHALHCRLNGEPIPAPVNGSPELKRIVLKACAFKPEDRFFSADDMCAALTVLREVSPSLTVSSSVAPERKPASAALITVALAGAAVVAGILYAVFSGIPFHF